MRANRSKESGLQSVATLATLFGLQTVLVLYLKLRQFIHIRIPHLRVFRPLICRPKPFSAFCNTSSSSIFSFPQISVDSLKFEVKVTFFASYFLKTFLLLIIFLFSKISLPSSFIFISEDIVQHSLLYKKGSYSFYIYLSRFTRRGEYIVGKKEKKIQKR